MVIMQMLLIQETNNLGQDLKSMVCDSFTQYNEAGIGVSISNNGYAQLVSIFTIGCDVGISVHQVDNVI